VSFTFFISPDQKVLPSLGIGRRL